IEESGAVAQAVARAVPSDHRQQERGGDDGIRAHWMGNAERAVGEGHSGMPLAEDEGLAWGDDYRERGDGTPVAKPLREAATGVFASDGPAGAEPGRVEPGERALEMRIEAPAQILDGGGIECLARSDQALTLAPSPGGKLVGGHGHLVPPRPALMTIMCRSTIAWTRKTA